MRNTHRALLLLLAGGLALIGIVGCSNTAARQKVLNFFFTGVPPPGATPLEQSPAETALANAANRRGVVVVSTNFVHGPYAANTCDVCHEVSPSGSVVDSGATQAAQGARFQATSMSGAKLAPVGQLCTGCHEGTSPTEAVAAGLWVHGPVSTGDCIQCHNAHDAPEQYMLQKPTDALCADCHAQGTLVDLPEHQDRTDCVACHAVHVGKDSRLLAADYSKSW
jgi:predicted CXXCH cytochrome family protein